VNIDPERGRIVPLGGYALRVDVDGANRLQVTAVIPDDAHALRLADTLGFHLGEDLSSIADVLEAIDAVLEGRASSVHTGLNDLLVQVGERDVRLVDEARDRVRTGEIEGLGYTHEAVRDALVRWRNIVVEKRSAKRDG